MDDHGWASNDFNDSDQPYVLANLLAILYVNGGVLSCEVLTGVPFMTSTATLGPWHTIPFVATTTVSDYWTTTPAQGDVVIESFTYTAAVGDVLLYCVYLYYFHHQDIAFTGCSDSNSSHHAGRPILALLLSSDHPIHQLLPAVLHQLHRSQPRFYRRIQMENALSNPPRPCRFCNLPIPTQ
jgi:hypothetical protein